jgi:hypothetical protein
MDRNERQRVAEIEDDLLESIQLAVPGFRRQQLDEFVEPRDELVENDKTEEENRILESYEQPPVEEDPQDAPPPPTPVSYAQALEAIELLRRFREEVIAAISRGTSSSSR